MSTPEDHPVLDIIARGLAHGPSILAWARRESECVEFFDANQVQWFEVVVRRIDAPTSR